MKSGRTKATSIPIEVKRKVYERDNGCCIMCGVPVYEGAASAHVIPRSRGGLGIEENIVTLCLECHRAYDQSKQRLTMYGRILDYLDKFYPDWDRDKVIFKKGQ